MAAVRSCVFFVSPSSPAFSAAAGPPLRGSPAILLPVAAARSEQQRIPSLKMVRPAVAAVVAPRRRLHFAARAQSGDRDSPPPSQHEGDHFAEEMEEISDYYADIISIDHGSLYVEATAMSAQVCLSANEALAMASDVVDSAALNLGTPNEISMDTIHRTVRAYADVFFDAAEDSHRRAVNRSTVVSFLRALAGLADVSHILLEGALEALSHALPAASLPAGVRAQRRRGRRALPGVQAADEGAGAQDPGRLRHKDMQDGGADDLARHGSRGIVRGAHGGSSPEGVGEGAQAHRVSSVILV